LAESAEGEAAAQDAGRYEESAQDAVYVEETEAQRNVVASMPERYQQRYRALILNCEMSPDEAISFILKQLN
jgi:hypothetical protein